MTRQQILDSLEDNVGLTKDVAADLIGYLNRLPQGPQLGHILHEVRSVQGYLGGVILPLVSALREDERDQGE